ncbi:MAG: hypothetical protein WCK89_23115, partial [bacterium]
QNPSNALTYAALRLNPSAFTNAAVRILGDSNVIYPSDLVVTGYTLIADGIAGTLTNLQVGGALAGSITHPHNYNTNETWLINLGM